MRVQFIKLDDWVGLYVDGKLVECGHSLDEVDVAQHLVGANNVESVWCEYDEDLDEIVCPNGLHISTDLPKEWPL